MLSNADYAERRAGDYRLSWLTHDIDVCADIGLEIGALDNPTLLPPGVSVEYVDYASTEALQAHPHEETVRRRDIVNVTHVWPGSGSLADVCGRQDYSFAIASHVIEHVPNVLGWFEGIHKALRPGGVFNLAIPDRRFTFDIRRKTSSLGEMVEAYMLGYTKPSIRQVFDHTYDASAVEPGKPWDETFNISAVPRYSGDSALALAYAQSNETLREGKYFDSHCWVFSPLSFLDCLEGSAKIGLFPFILSDFAPTKPDSFEFFVSLRKETELDGSGGNLYNWRLATIAHAKSRVEKDLHKHLLLAQR